MRPKSEIDAEIAVLKALVPQGRFASETQLRIDLMIDELSHGIDDTAEEWNDLDDIEQLAVMDARQWKEGDCDDRPSTGWGELAK